MRESIAIQSITSKALDHLLWRILFFFHCDIDKVHSLSEDIAWRYKLIFTVQIKLQEKQGPVCGLKLIFRRSFHFLFIL